MSTKPKEGRLPFVLALLAIATAVLVQTSTASAACIPVGRLSWGSHGWGQASGHAWDTFKKIFDKVNSSPEIYENMGCPMSDYLVAIDGVGAFLFFEHGAVVTDGDPNKPAFAVMGNIFLHWRALDYERGVMGYPTSDELDANGGRISWFAGGAIVWHGEIGAQRMHGDILTSWLKEGVGFPSGEEFPSPGGRDMCPKTHRQQWFKLPTPPPELDFGCSNPWFACWDANSRNVTWHQAGPRCPSWG